MTTQPPLEGAIQTFEKKLRDKYEGANNVDLTHAISSTQMDSIIADIRAEIDLERAHFRNILEGLFSDLETATITEVPGLFIEANKKVLPVTPPGER